MLSYYNIKLNIEKDIDKALTILKSNKKYDLIFVDLDKHNEEIIDIIKSITKETIIIGMKSITYDYSIDYYKDKKVDYILKKPFTLPNINYLLKNLLKK